jgi:hypothetical protein
VHGQLGVIIGYFELADTMRHTILMEYVLLGVASRRVSHAYACTRACPCNPVYPSPSLCVSHTECLCACRSIGGNLPQYLAHMDRLALAVAAVQRYQLAAGERAVTALVRRHPQTTRLQRLTLSIDLCAPVCVPSRVCLSAGLSLSLCVCGLRR